MTAWINAYVVAWHLRQDAGNSTAGNTSHDPYVHLCAKLLAAEIQHFSIPIVTVDGHSQGRIQTLWIDIIDGHEKLLLLHPQFESTRNNFGSDFLTSIETAWSLAGEAVTGGKSAFWYVTEADGSPVISEQQSGTSASAAAFRAFWHLRRGLRADDDVFVLASCASDDGVLHDVSDLGAKFSGIEYHHTARKLETPPTIVIAASAKNRTVQDITAITRARSWAEIVEVNTADELIAVRSVTVQAAIDYLAHLAEQMDATPWYRKGVQVRFSEVHVTPYVWKPQPRYSLLADAPSAGGRTEEHDWRPAGYDPSVAERETGPRLERTRKHERVPWSETFRNNEAMTVITGGPGSGKTSILRWTARMVALLGLDEIGKRSIELDQIHWPVLTDLDAWVSSDGQPIETLTGVVIDSLALIENWGANRLKALRFLMRKRLIQSKANTTFFFDALDQVPESRVILLGNRLQAVASFSHPELPNGEPVSQSTPCSIERAKEIFSRGTKILISTRESGLRTHYQAMSFTSKSTLQAAALSAEEAKELAAKWLGADQATRLEAHLRANPALNIVADSPLLLTLACLVQSEQPQQNLPETPAALYQEIMRLLAKGAWRNGGAKAGVLPDADELLDSLPPIVWRLFSRDAATNRFDRSTLLHAITCATGRSQVEATKLLSSLVDLGFLESSGTHDGAEYFQFRHATFREFLAACHVASQINRDGWQAAEVDTWQTSSGWTKAKAGHLLDTRAFEPAWEPLLVFTAALMKEPLPLIEILADRTKDDLFRHRLYLLCKCYGALSLEQQTRLATAMHPVFVEIMRIATRSTRSRGERLALWADWIKPLLASPLAVNALCDGLLSLTGNFSTMGWSTGVEWRVVELLKEGLGRGRVSEQVVGKIAASLDRDVARWGYDAALLAWRLAEPAQRKKLQAEFLEKLRSESVPIPARAGIAAALVLSNDQNCAKVAVDYLIALTPQPGQFRGGETVDMYVAAKIFASLLDNSFAPIVAPVFATHLLHPNSNSQHAFSHAIIDKAAESPTNKWLDCLLAIVLSNEYEHSDDVRRWAAEVMAQRSDPHLRDLGLNTLLKISENKKSHCWAYAARWLVENAADPFCKQARELLFAEATNLESDHRRTAVAELLDMGEISPLGKPIQEAVHQAVLHELREYGEEDGTRLHVSVPGIAEKDMDMILFRENPAAVIKALHTFGGPKMYHRKGRHRDEMEKDRHWKGRLLVGTSFWPKVLSTAIDGLKTGGAKQEGELGIAVFGASGSDLVEILQITFLTTRGHERIWPLRELLYELHRRGWRLRLHGRQIEVLRKGQEEPRADARFGY